MDFNNQAPRQSQRFQGNWTCAKCTGAITELPFDPDPARLDKLLCKNCHRERAQSFRGPRRFGDR